MRRALAPTALALLIASCGGSSGTTTPPVSGPGPVATIGVVLDQASVGAGLTTTARAELRDAAGTVLTDRSVVWTTGSAATAVVSQAGSVIAISPGQAAITATSEGKSGKALLTVTANPVASLSISARRTSLAIGSTMQVVGVPRDGSGRHLLSRQLAWESSNPAVVGVNGAGVVTAVGPGQANVTVSSEGRSAIRAFVVPAATHDRVEVTVASPTLGVGQSTQGAAVVRDASGAVVSGATVTWATSAPAVASVDSSRGIVTAVGPGTAVITATSGGFSGSTPVAVQVVKPVTAVAQTREPGEEVLQPPAVVVTTPEGLPAAGVPVVFSVTFGGGTLASASTTTDGSGVARAGAWAFGTAGVQAVQAFVPSIPDATVDFWGFGRTAGTGFDITILFMTPTTDSVLKAFIDARERIQEFVVGDVPDAPVDLSAALMAQCGGPALNQVVDDVLIIAEVTNIDGVGEILGQAGPCFVRSTGTKLPVVGHMMFDSADLANLDTRGALGATILHEMMHVLGFGTIWDRAGLLVGSGGLLPSFNGAQALASFVAENGGGSYPGTAVPVEGSGAGVGTANSHWRESDFDDELMTGFLDLGVPEPMSATTIGSMKDLGYTVDLGQADPFSWGTATVALRAAMLLDAQRVQMVDDVRHGPVQVLGPDGRPLFP